MSYDNKTEGSYCSGEGFRTENEASPVRVHLRRAKNKVGFAGLFSAVDFVDIPEISKTIFPT